MEMDNFLCLNNSSFNLDIASPLFVSGNQYKIRIKASDGYNDAFFETNTLDVIQASVLTYVTLYNISIFYSNLLVRMLRKAYLLSSANESTDKSFSINSIKTTKDKLGAGTGGINSDTLYGGKKIVTKVIKN
jgi:hypothetical protein